jgi:tol-pal system protein YbgF
MRLALLTLSALLLGTDIAAAQNMQNFNRDIYDESDLPQPAQTQPIPTTVQAPQLQATDIQMRMNAMENLVRGLTGQVEKLQFHNNQLMQLQQKMNADNDVRFKDVEQKQTAHDTTLKSLSIAQQNLAKMSIAQEKDTTEKEPEKIAEKTAEKPADEASEKGATLDVPKSTKALGTLTKESKKDDAPIKTDVKTDVKTDATSAQAQYDEAFTALRQAKYDAAEQSFNTFLKNNPKHALTENAKYWLAETFYVRGKFQEAAVAFAEAYQEFPKGAKAADNLLKLSMSLGSLGKKPDACLTLSELAKKFPQATAVTKNRAAQQKKAMGCS